MLGNKAGRTSATNDRSAPDSEDPKIATVLRNFVSAASFQRVAKITPSAWAEHAPFAFWLVEALRPRCIVELGVFHGFSYLTLCQAASALSPRALCYGVDNWRGDEHVGLYGEEVFETLKNYHDPLYSDFSLLMRSSFDEAAPQFADGSIDLLHIDGTHVYNAVKHDFETWQPKLSDRAIVLFHDTNERHPEFGVWKLWEELSAAYPSFEFLHNHGLGVLGCGSKISPHVQRLFAAAKDSETTDALREVYSRLGALYGEGQAVEKIEAGPAAVSLIDRFLSEARHDTEKTWNEKLALTFLPVSVSEFRSHPEYDEVFRFFTQEDRFRGMDTARLLGFVLNAKHVLTRCAGSLAELGVYQGQSAAVLSYYARKFSRKMYIADTFSGFAKAQHEPSMNEGKIAAFKDVNLDRVRSVIGDYEGNRWVVGMFPESITEEMESDTFSFVSIDCNLYQPILAGLKFFWPRLNCGGQIFIHDYDSEHWPGACRAVEEFCKSEKIAGMMLPDYTGTYVLTKQLSGKSETNEVATDGFHPRLVRENSMFNVDQDFSQYGEQQIILDFFSRQTRPYTRYCVDAGAYDGVVGSNSRALFLSGWAGLAIEPNPRAFVRLARLYADRPEIKLVQMALSDQKRSAVPMKFSIGPAGVAEEDQWMYGQVSTLHDDFARSYEIEHAYRYVTELVEIDTLSNVMRANRVPRDLGFLSIDCEGEDLKIVKELDLNTYRPLLLCIESTESSRHFFADVIARFGYTFVAQTTSNAFFERS